MTTHTTFEHEMAIDRYLCMLLMAMLFSLVLIVLTGCGEPPWNNPNPPLRDDKITYQSMISSTPPKHLDPALSYATDESLFIMQIYEPPMDYHFLKRPYELIPGALVSAPEVTYLDAEGQPVEEGDPAVAFTRYTLRLREDLHFQPHPAFALDEAGQPLYLFDNPADGAQFKQIPDFPVTGDRPVRASDYAYAIRRLADPQNASPMLGFMSQYIVGMKAFSEQLAELPRDNWVNLEDFPMAGLEVVDDHTLNITIKASTRNLSTGWRCRFFADSARSGSLLPQSRFCGAQPHAGLVAGGFRPLHDGEERSQ